MVRMMPCAMAILLTMAGCDAGPIGTIRPDPAHTAVVKTYDGTYRTTIRLTTSTASALGQSWCQTPGQAVVAVTDGDLSYAVPHPNVPGSPAPAFEATFAADGSFSGQITGGTMTGRVTGTHIEGRIDGAACGYAFTGERV
jgi:hypothetical protein